MNRQRTASFALALLGTLFFLGGASPMARATAAINTFYTFNPNVPPYTDGIEPTGIVSASDGNFYGVTFQGGLYSYGTFYRMNPAGVETVLYTFYISGNTNGSAYPVGLVQGADGNFYGTTMAGGTYGIGTVYKITPAGVLTTLASFGPDTNSGGPSGAMTEGADGDFYGTTDGYYAGEYGTIFKVTPSGAFNTLHVFQGADGTDPGPLTLGSDGNFYGYTQRGGTYNYGSLFRITPAGVFTTVHVFTTLNAYPFYTNGDGAVPNALIAASDGNLYGSTTAGGANAKGTLFKLTTDGTLTTLFNVGATALTLGRDGSIYGAMNTLLSVQYSTWAITLFKINTYGMPIPVARVTPNDPDMRINNLIQGSNGSFYFTRWMPSDYGEIDALSYSPFDLLGSGQPDLLFQNPATGQLSATSMTGATASAPTPLSAIAPYGWKAVGIGDFNQDAQPDILLQNQVSGQLALWLTNSPNTFTGVYISSQQDPAWQVVSVADLNGDGTPDLLFQNSSTGQLAVWYMNGTTVIQGAYLSAAPPSGWKAIGTGDFNGDGQQDLLFQNPSTGQLALWYLNGAQVTGGAYITPSQSPGWQAVSVVDLNEDGKADIVFQNSSTGQLAVWYMNGTSVSGAAYITSDVTSGWQVAGPR